MNTKRSAQAELVHMDLQVVIAEMNRYAARRLQNVNTKQLEGKTPEDFTSDTILKVVEGIRDWQTASTNDFKKFLFGCLSSEISHFLEKINRRDVSIIELMEEKLDFESMGGVTYANPDVINENPKGYNNLDDEKEYYS